MAPAKYTLVDCPEAPPSNQAPGPLTTLTWDEYQVKQMDIEEEERMVDRAQAFHCHFTLFPKLPVEMKFKASFLRLKVATKHDIANIFE
jgi:hypothetical protein